MLAAASKTKVAATAVLSYLETLQAAAACKAILSKGAVSELVRGSGFLGLVLVSTVRQLLLQLRATSRVVRTRSKATAASTAFRHEGFVSELRDAAFAVFETVPHDVVSSLSGSGDEDELCGLMSEFAGADEFCGVVSESSRADDICSLVSELFGAISGVDTGSAILEAHWLAAGARAF